MIKASLIVLAGLAVTRLLRSQSAAIRHWVLFAALACAAVAPAVERLAPGWNLPALRAPMAARIEQPLTAVRTRESASQAVPAVQAGRPQPSVPLDPPTASRALGLIWMAGTALSVFVLLVGFGRLAWLASRSERLRQGPWADLAHDIARQYGLNRPVVLLQSDHPTMLVTWGLLRPKVILPAEAREWTPDRARIVLCHELAHIRRGDWAAQMMAELLRSIYWFNPLMWIAGRRLRRESEQACDDEVLNLGIEGPVYARHLLDLARAARKHRQSVLPDVPAPAMMRPSSLERRVSAMLNAGLNHHPAGGRARLAALTALLALTVLIGGFGAAAQSFVTLSGSVVDPMNGLVPGVTLTLTNARNQAKHEVSSDDGGRFEFVGLPPGDYVLEARFPGFKALKTDLAVAGQNVHRNLALQIGSLRETVSVAVSASDPAAPPPSAPRAALPRRGTAGCTTASTGGNLVPPRKLKDVHPVYPRHLQGASRVAGVVTMDARIGPDGFVRHVEVLEPAHPDLAQSAVEAVRQWEFDSTLLNCVPVEVAMMVTVSFAVEK